MNALYSFADVLPLKSLLGPLLHLLPVLESSYLNYGNILNWTWFWEQFCIAIHDHTSISDAEKLVYLQQALKDSSAKTVIEGLTRSGEHYTETIDCLKVRFNRPRLIHQAYLSVL